MENGKSRKEEYWVGWEWGKIIIQKLLFKYDIMCNFKFHIDKIFWKKLLTSNNHEIRKDIR